jgi:hypothetical protein
MVITLALVTLAVLAAVLARHRHRKRDRLLSLSLFAYYAAILAYGEISEQRVDGGSRLTPIALAMLLVHTAAAIWFAKSRLLVVATAPLAIWLALMAAIGAEMSLSGVWF